MSEPSPFTLHDATPADVPQILAFIRELADYERLAHEVTATEPLLHTALFGPAPIARAVIARAGEIAAGYALFYFSFSTFLARPGVYLEDLYVTPAWRHRGLGRLLMADVARIAIERGGGRMEWSVLDWNEMALRTYRAVGATPMSAWTMQRLSGSELEALAAAAPAVRRSSAR